jgi:hypothetical protein
MIQRHGSAELEAELNRLQDVARERRSVDRFARAGAEAFLWIVLTGVCAKLFWDSARIPLFFYALVLVDALLLLDAVRSLSRARAELREENEALRKLRDLRARLGIDPPGARP